MAMKTPPFPAAVDQADIGALAAGQHVVFSVGAYPGRTFQGTLQSISPLAQAQGDAVRYPVVIAVDQHSLRGAHLFPGMTATTAIILKQRFGVLLVPVGAVRYAQQAAAAAAHGSGPLTPTRVRDALTLANQMLQQLDANSDPSADDPTAGLLLEQTGGEWVVKPVVLGLTDGRSYEVLAGLRAGERVVTAVGAPASGGATGRGAPPEAGPRPARV
jgi:hypothetical protein